MTQKEIIRKFELDPAQADEVGNKAIDQISEFLNDIEYEVLEDGITILSSEDDIMEISGGHYTNVADFEREANERYLAAFEQEARLV